MVKQESSDIGQDGFQLLPAVFLSIEIDTDDFQALVVKSMLNLLEPCRPGRRRAGSSLPRTRAEPLFLSEQRG